MAMLPLVMINGTIMKYKNKTKNTRFTWKPLREKTTDRGESFTMNMKEITKYSGIENKS